MNQNFLRLQSFGTIQIIQSSQKQIQTQNILSEIWKKDCQDYSVKWGINSIESIEKVNLIRPDFKGIDMIDKVTGGVVYKTRFNKIYQISRLFNWMFLILFVFICFKTNYIICQIDVDLKKWELSQSQYYGSILNAIVIKMYDQLQLFVLKYTIKFENHETFDNEKESQFSKLLVFSAINTQLPMLNQVQQVSQEPHICSSSWFNGNCWHFLGYQLFMIETTFLMFNIIFIQFPQLLQFWKLFMQILHNKSLKTESIKQKECENLKWNYQKMVLMDFDRQILESIIEIGYVQMFGSTMPICQLILILNLLIKLRQTILDCAQQQRRMEPVVRVGLGFWNNIKNGLMYIACIVNQGLLCFIANADDNDTPNQFNKVIQEILTALRFEKVNDVLVKTVMFVFIQNLFVVLIIITNITNNSAVSETILIETRAKHVIKTIQEMDK